MQISVTGQQIDVGEALRRHVEKRLTGSVSKYFDNAIDAKVVFSHEGPLFRTHVRVHVGKGMEWEGQADESEIHLSFNTAVDHIEKQLRRYKRKKRDHHRDQLNVADQ
jgi:ribosomal subunit interface protein